jgi:hypothetical protein
LRLALAADRWQGQLLSWGTSRPEEESREMSSSVHAARPRAAGYWYAWHRTCISYMCERGRARVERGMDSLMAATWVERAGELSSSGFKPVARGQCTGV